VDENPSANVSDVNAELAAAAEDLALPPDDVTSSEPSIRPDHYWTARLLAAGFTIEECEQIRALPRATILRHARLSSAESSSPQGYTSKAVRLE